MVSGPTEIAVGLWVGTQATCSPSQAALRDLGRYLVSASLGLGCPWSTRRQDGTCSLLSLPGTAGMVFSCQLPLGLFLPWCLLELPPREPAPASCLLPVLLPGWDGYCWCPLGRKERQRVPDEVARTDYLLGAINCRAFPPPPPLFCS